MLANSTNSSSSGAAPDQKMPSPAAIKGRLAERRRSIARATLCGSAPERSSFGA
jgi:hypothetical protein